MSKILFTIIYVYFIILFGAGQKPNKQFLMKTKSNKQKTNLIPMTLNVVNLQVLMLSKLRKSSRYQKSKIKQKRQQKKQHSYDQNSPVLGTNRIYYKKGKQRDQQLYFSDYRIKLGSFVSPQIKNRQKSVPHNCDDFDTIGRQKLESTFHDNQEKKKTIHFQTINQNIQLSQYQSNGLIQKYKRQYNTDRQLGELQSFTQDKKRLFTKMERRNYPNTIKMSFSSKNYKKGNLQSKKGQFQQEQNRLDGWIIQSPLFQLDKKLDITQYAQQSDKKNFYSERKKTIKEELKKITRLGKIKKQQNQIALDQYQ